MSDILFRTKDSIFSYRVAGICIQNDKILLQKPTDDKYFAFPGGHVSFGETNKEALEREFKEEIGADISVDELRWVGEIFFTWDDKPCHQICLYYTVQITDGNTQTKGIFTAHEQPDGRNFDIEFHWVPFDMISSIEIYPSNVEKLLENLECGVQHFVYRE